MARTFNIDTDTFTAEEFEFRGAQKENFTRTNAVRVFKWRDIRGDARNLPNYVWNAIKDAGYTPVYLGGTTYKYSVIGLVK